MHQILSSIFNPFKYVWKTLSDNEGFSYSNINSDSEMDMGIIPKIDWQLKEEMR